MTNDLEPIVWQNIWLENCDQNVTFERAFTPQYCKVLGRRTSIDGEKDWYLIKLKVPFDYEGKEYGCLMIRSLWVGCPIGKNEATSVFIFLVPNPDAVTHLFEMDRSFYVAWGLTALDPKDIKR